MNSANEGRRYHEANAGRDSKPVIFIFEGNNILWMLLGCGLALLAFRLCHGNLQWSLGESLAVALVPLVAATLYVVLLKSGKPKSFDREFFEWVAVRVRSTLHGFGLVRERPYFAPPPPPQQQRLQDVQPNEERQKNHANLC